MSLIKKKKISDKLNDYSVCLCGESGIGKTTTMVEACEKEFGEDGYAIFNTGKEQGVDCLEGASYIDIPTWKHFEAVVKDIINNKDTEYPDLKVIVIDTLDQLIELCEPVVIDMWNRENIGKKDFVPAKTLNAAWSGFGKGEDKVIEIILNKIWELKKVGVTTWFCCHVKTREIVDPITNQTFTSLSTLMMQKYFNGFKTKMHVIGVACIDRTIEAESTGRKNIVTKKDITVNKIKEERRKIVFHDDNYSVDSKSRFVGIVDEIPLTADDLLKALHDAIKVSKNRTKKSDDTVTEKKTKTKSSVTKKVVKEVEDSEDDLVNLDDDLDAIVKSEESNQRDYPEDLLGTVKELIKNANSEEKKEVKKILVEYGAKVSEIPVEGLMRIYDELA